MLIKKFLLLFELDTTKNFVHFVLVPPKSKEELERLYLTTYGEKDNMPTLTPVLFALPVFVIILIVISCVWWYEREKKKKEMLLKQNHVDQASEVVIVKEEQTKPRIVC